MAVPRRAPFLLLCGLLACGSTEPPAALPNLVVVTLDTTRADHLGLYGYFRDTSPRLDAFAADAVVFDRALAPMATTLATHFSLFTGTHPLVHGVLANGMGNGRRYVGSPRLRSLAARGLEVGYDTAAFVSAMALSEGTGIERGFERFDEPAGASRRYASHTTNAALRWLESAMRPSCSGSTTTTRPGPTHPLHPATRPSSPTTPWKPGWRLAGSDLGYLDAGHRTTTPQHPFEP